MNSRRAFLTAAPLAALGGCATINGWLQNPAIAAGLEDAIDVAVGLVFPALGANALTVANEALTAVEALISLLSGGASATTTIATLGADAEAKVNADASLNADVKTALINVIGFAAGALAAGTSAISPTTSGPLVTVFSDIQNALQLFIQGSASPAGRALLQRVGVRV